MVVQKPVWELRVFQCEVALFCTCCRFAFKTDTTQSFLRRQVDSQTAGASLVHIVPTHQSMGRANRGMRAWLVAIPLTKLVAIDRFFPFFALLKVAWETGAAVYWSHCLHTALKCELYDLSMTRTTCILYVVRMEPMMCDLRTYIWTIVHQTHRGEIATQMVENHIPKMNSGYFCITGWTNLEG